MKISEKNITGGGLDTVTPMTYGTTNITQAES